MHPMDLAHRLLPAATFRMLETLSNNGVPTNCGHHWEDAVLDRAWQAGPHVSALTDENVILVWEDLSYQENAGFVQIVTEAELFDTICNPHLKLSRIAVVLQANRHGRIILNLSAQVDMGHGWPPGKRCHRNIVHPSVNETTMPAANQATVGDLGTARPALLKFMFDADCTWEIRWQKIDLSDGFWRMIVELGQEYNFIFQMPQRPGDSEIFYAIPSSLQMGWMNSPAYFCTGTEATHLLLQCIMALTITTGLPVLHCHEDHYVDPNSSSAPASQAWLTPSEFLFLSRVFVDDFMNELAGPIDRPHQQEEQRWASRAALHAIHTVFPPPDVLQHVGGKDSVSIKKLLAKDAQYKQTETLLGFAMCGSPGQGRTTWLPPPPRQKGKIYGED